MLDEDPPSWGLPEDLWPYTSWLHTAKKYVLKGCSSGGRGRDLGMVEGPKLDLSNSSTQTNPSTLAANATWLGSEVKTSKPKA
jgi:hypothetical protein